jgi:hypothetical protein
MAILLQVCGIQGNKSQSVSGINRGEEKGILFYCSTGRHGGDYAPLPERLQVKSTRLGGRPFALAVLSGEMDDFIFSMQLRIAIELRLKG